VNYYAGVWVPIVVAVIKSFQGWRFLPWHRRNSPAIFLLEMITITKVSSDRKTLVSAMKDRTGEGWKMANNTLVNLC
jgi:hypothetical protein